mmetsp:Transcript_35413/g.94956  ORF Transcript_35413/g.94956 Transcript_35413/m.94956 type:complete len:716 (+) Transcript_35413:1695-3842(+)
MIHRARTCRVVVMLNYHSLKIDRGRGQRELVQILTDLFGSADQLLESKASILLGISCVPKNVDGRRVDFKDVRSEVMSGCTGMGDGMAQCLKVLSEEDRLFVLHPADAGNSSWSLREEIVKRIQNLELLTEPGEIFRTVLTVEDERSLRELVSEMAARVTVELGDKEYPAVARGMAQMEGLLLIDNIVVERLVGDVKGRVNTFIDSLHHRGVCDMVSDKFDEALAVANELNVMGEALAEVSGIKNAAECAKELRGLVEQTRKQRDELAAAMKEVDALGKDKAALDTKLELMEQERAKQERDKATMLEKQEALVEAHQAEQQALEARSAEEMERLKVKLETASNEEKKVLQKQIETIEAETKAKLASAEEKQRVAVAQSEGVIDKLNEQLQERERAEREAKEELEAMKRKEADAVLLAAIKEADFVSLTTAIEQAKKVKGVDTAKAEAVLALLTALKVAADKKDAGLLASAIEAAIAGGLNAENEQELLDVIAALKAASDNKKDAGLLASAIRAAKAKDVNTVAEQQLLDVLEALKAAVNKKDADLLASAIAQAKEDGVDTETEQQVLEVVKALRSAFVSADISKLETAINTARLLEVTVTDEAALLRDLVALKSAVSERSLSKLRSAIPNVDDRGIDTKEEKKLLQGLEAQEVERERERKSKCSKCSHKFCGSKFTHTDPGNPNPCNSSDNWPASTSRRKCGDWSGAWCCRCDRD